MQNFSFLSRLEVAEKFVVVVVGWWSRPSLRFSFSQAEQKDLGLKYQPSGAGGTRSPPATPHRLQHLPAHFIQNGRWGPGTGQTLGY